MDVSLPPPQPVSLYSNIVGETFDLRPPFHHFLVNLKRRIAFNHGCFTESIDEPLRVTLTEDFKNDYFTFQNEELVQYKFYTRLVEAHQIPLLDRKKYLPLLNPDNADKREVIEIMSRSIRELFGDSAWFGLDSVEIIREADRAKKEMASRKRGKNTSASPVQRNEDGMLPDNRAEPILEEDDETGQQDRPISHLATSLSAISVSDPHPPPVPFRSSNRQPSSRSAPKPSASIHGKSDTKGNRSGRHPRAEPSESLNANLSPRIQSYVSTDARNATRG